MPVLATWLRRGYHLPFLGITLIAVYAALAVSSGVPTEFIGLAAAGPLLWLFRVVREVVRLFDGKSSGYRVLLYTVILIALTIVEYAALYNSDRHAFPGMVTTFSPIYFSISTFTTAGYGDIHPTSSSSQVLVSSQMMLDWVETTVVVGLVLAVLLQALNARRGAPATSPATASGPAPAPAAD